MIIENTSCAHGFSDTDVGHVGVLRNPPILLRGHNILLRRDAARFGPPVVHEPARWYRLGMAQEKYTHTPWMLLAGCGMCLLGALEVAAAHTRFERTMRDQDANPHGPVWDRVDDPRAALSFEGLPWCPPELPFDLDPEGLPLDAPGITSRGASLGNLTFVRTVRSRTDRGATTPLRTTRVAVRIAGQTALRCETADPAAANPLEARQGRDMRLIQFRCHTEDVQKDPGPGAVLTLQQRAFGWLRPPTLEADRARHHVRLVRRYRALGATGGVLGLWALGLLWAAVQRRRDPDRPVTPRGTSPYRVVGQSPETPTPSATGIGPRLSVGIAVASLLAYGYITWELKTLERAPPWTLPSVAVGHSVLPLGSAIPAP